MANENWEGKLTFDPPRHKQVLGLPIDYPRINQFPEWFTVEADKNYEVRIIQEQTTKAYTGKELQEGIYLEVTPERNVAGSK
jgi:hypothetical protein